MVRRYGGVLEHPSGSALFREEDLGLPIPGGTTRDAWGGYVLPVSQKWWGHRAEKRTWLYIVGVEPAELPPMPITLGEASHALGSSLGRNRTTARPEVSKREREATPPDFAAWLVEVARRSKVREAQG